MSIEKIALMASRSESAQSALQQLSDRYTNTDMDSADAIVALGGDGFMLETLHRNMERDLPIYGICLLYTSPSPRDVEESRMPSSA